MLSLSKVKSSAKTTEYFAKDDYYASNDPNHQKFSNWYGNGAKELGLEGTVGAEAFKNILDGRLPNGQVVGIVKGADLIHDAGRDLTFSAPKSVSIMALVYEDKRLIEAHNEAVKNTLDEIEKHYLKTRIKNQGKISLESTGKIVTAMFRHELSRDLDPQLHSHAIVANITVDDKGKWRSALFDEIYNNKKFLGVIYRSNLAKSVKELGYQIEHKGKDCLFEISHVPNKVIDLFSNRSKKIKSIANGKASQKELEKITLNSRENKNVREYDHNLAKTWRQKTEELLPKLDSKIAQIPSPSSFSSSDRPKSDHNSTKESLPNQDDKESLSNPDTAHQAVYYAIQHLSERKTIFSKNDLITTALNDTLSETTHEDIIKAVNDFTKDQKLLLVKKAGLPRNTYTTTDLLAKENAIIRLMNDGKNQHLPITKDLSKYQDALSKLNDGQKRSAELILSSKDMVTGIQGFAGVGKTFMLQTVKEIAREEGCQLIGLSPTGVAAKNLDESAKITSITLQKFLGKYDGVAVGRGTEEGLKDMRETFQNKAVIVDESSMISTTQMKNLLTIASKLNFRLILVGDKKQLDSVEAGVPFFELQRNGMAFTDMKEILRQKNLQLKSAVYSTIDGHINQAFKAIECDVFETKEVADLAVRKFMEMPLLERQQSIILTPANDTRQQVNAQVSQLLYEERIKELDGQKSPHEIYSNRNLTEAEKTRAYRFQVGDVILFGKDRKFIGVKKNSYCEVKKIDTRLNLITIKTGLFSSETFDPIKLKGKAEKNYFEVFEKDKRIFYKGDQVAFNRSLSGIKVINSDKAVITKIGKLNLYLSLDDGRKIKIGRKSLEAKHLDHSYAVTAHKAQGLTRKNVIAVCESYRKLLTSQKNFYVEISRAEEKAIIITDNKDNVINRLKENTGIEISAREHQDIPSLGINLIGQALKKKPDNLSLEQDKSIKEEIHRFKIKPIIHNYQPYEIKEHFLDAIKSSITLEAADVETAIDQSLENKGKKVRFGKKKEYEICWHGEAGYVKNHKTGELLKWGLNSIKTGRKTIEISMEDFIKKQQQEKELREKQAKQKIITEKEVAIKASNYFRAFHQADPIQTKQNKYLQKKGINQKVIEGVRFTKDNKLVVPVQDGKGEIHSLQFIDQEGKKTFLKGGRKIGNFFMIGSNKLSNSKEIYLAEGFATGVSIHLATNKPVAITFDAGNIGHVLRNLKEIHPNKEFTIAADNDLWKEHNVGRNKAELAAKTYGAKVILPNFTLAHKDEMPTDFNDLHKLSGIHEVQRQLGMQHQMTIDHHHDLQI